MGGTIPLRMICEFILKIKYKYYLQHTAFYFRQSGSLKVHNQLINALQLSDVCKDQRWYICLIIEYLPVSDEHVYIQFAGYSEIKTMNIQDVKT